MTTTPRKRTTPRPDTLIVHRFEPDGEWYCIRLTPDGAVRTISEGYVNEEDAIGCAKAQTRAAVIDTDFDPASGRPEWLTYNGPRPRRRGRWARRRR